jgi:elongation factor G
LKSYQTPQIRNVALIGHGFSGKTLLAEAMLECGKAIPRMGSVDSGNSVMDWDLLEIDRKSTINLSAATVELKDAKINVLDTPGFPDFVGDVHSALAVCESAVSVVCAVSGLQVQTLQTWKYSVAADNARIVFINKMDRENADFNKVLGELREKFGAEKIAPVTIPVGSQSDFKGVIDLLGMKAEVGGKRSVIPDDLKDEAGTYRNALMENVAGNDEALMNKYLESGELSSEELEKGLQIGMRDGSIIPVLCGSAAKNIGVNMLLSLIASSAPAPSPSAEPSKGASCVVFKTLIDTFIGKLSYFKVLAGTVKADTGYKNSRTGSPERGKTGYIFGKKLVDTAAVVAGDIGSFLKVDQTRAGDIVGNPSEKKIPFPKPCYAVAVEVETKGTEDKLANGLSKLVEDDPVMFVKRDPETKQTIINGTGETQIGLVCKKLERDFKVKVREIELIVPYRETITRKAHGDYRHKKQTGGAGQFAHVIIDIEPMNRGEKYEFVNKIVGGNIPKNFIPAVEKGIKAGMVKGTLAGFPVVDIRTLVVDGKYHTVDSNEMAFKTAGRGAFQQAQQAAVPILLEPIYEVTVLIPDEYTGDVMGDLNQRRGRVDGMEPQGDGVTLIRARVPYAEILKYNIDLKALTQGRGTFEIGFSNYGVVPGHMQQKVIDKYGSKKAAAEES